MHDRLYHVEIKLYNEYALEFSQIPLMTTHRLWESVLVVELCGDSNTLVVLNRLQVVSMWSEFRPDTLVSGGVVNDKRKRDRWQI